MPALPLRTAAAAAIALALLSSAGAACARSNDAAAHGGVGADGAPSSGGARGPVGDSASVRADRARIQGDSGARLWMVVVSDFQCPYCRVWHDSTYPALVREYVQTGKLRMAYVNFPLPSHANAWPAAEAVMCSGVQGKFWPMQDKVFSTQDRWAGLADPSAFFDSLATTVGADASRMRACVKSHATKPLIQADFDRASAAGINSTPNFFIGDQRVEGAQPIENFRRVIDAALAKQAGGAGGE